MSQSLRLVFDAHAIAPERSGIGDYSWHLLQALFKYFPDELNISVYAAGSISHVRSMEDVRTATEGVEQGSLYSPRHQWELPQLLRKGNFDLLHTPDYCIPLANHAIPMVATIHDIVPLVYSQLMFKSKKVRFLKLYRYYLRLALRRCAEVITVSEFSKQEILRYFSEDEGHITPIHVADYLDVVQKFEDSDAIPGVEAGSYMLFVGRQEPYKGIRLLLEAYAEVYKDLEPQVNRLVFAGKIDKRYPWNDIINKLQLQDRVLFTDYINERQLSWAYAHARGLIFPSLYEGFGSPPLDAMKHGTPIASSNRASVPEIVGDAGLTFDPEDKDSFKKALIEIATNGNLRTELIEKGKRRLQDFSWELTAKNTVEVYKTALHDTR
jgi:glycosyltransferase involved in cell wall biosynthesis